LKLNNKVALVTGASRGIGRSIAIELAREGADIVVNYLRSETEAMEVVEQVKALGKNAIAIKADVSRSEDVENMINSVLERFKRIDILVNNAGIYNLKVDSILNLDEEDWDKVIDTNLKGTFLCCRAVARPMLRQKSGVIINISSNSGMSAVSTNPFNPHYAASKGGIIAFSRALALGLAPCIRVNVVAPGIIDTETSMSDMRGPASFSDERTRTLKRNGKPEEVAKVVAFLASDDSSFIEGETIVVDGGTIMH